MEASTYTDAKVIAASKNFVNVIAHGEDSHGTRDVIVNGREKKSWCKEYWGIDCSVHKEGSKAVGNFMKGSYGTPTTLFVDPDGKEISRKPGSAGAGELVKLMAEALAKVPGDHVSAIDWNSGKKQIADAEEAIGKEDYKKALELVGKVARSKVKAVAAMAADVSKKLEDKAGEMLEEAKGKLESDKPEAKKLLKKIVEQFKGLDAAKKALEMLKEIKD